MPRSKGEAARASGLSTVTFPGEVTHESNKDTGLSPGSTVSIDTFTEADDVSSDTKLSAIIKPHSLNTKLPISGHYKLGSLMGAGPSDLTNNHKGYCLCTKIPGPVGPMKMVNRRAEVCLSYELSAAIRATQGFSNTDLFVRSNRMCLNLSHGDRICPIHSHDREHSQAALLVAPPKYTPVIGPISNKLRGPSHGQNTIQNKEDVRKFMGDRYAEEEAVEEQRDETKFNIVDASNGGRLRWKNRAEIGVLIRMLINKVGIATLRAGIDLYGNDMDQLVSGLNGCEDLWHDINTATTERGWSLCYLRFDRVKLIIGLSQLGPESYVVTGGPSGKITQKEQVLSTMERLQRTEAKLLPRIQELKKGPRKKIQQVAWRSTILTTNPQSWAYTSACAVYIDPNFEDLQAKRKGEKCADYLNFMRKVHGVEVALALPIAIKDGRTKWASRTAKNYALLESRMQIERFNPYAAEEQHN